MLINLFLAVRRWCFVVFLLASLLLTQTLGGLHGIVHADANGHGALALGEPSAHSAHSALADHTHIGTSQDSALGSLFSGHKDSSDCQTFDQLCHADAVVGVAWVTLPLVLSTFALLLLSGLATARWHAQFLARGPPSLR